MKKKLACAVGLLALSACGARTYSVLDLDGATLLATCYTDMTLGFCRVVTPPGTQAVPAGSQTQAISEVAQTGAMLAGMGAGAVFMKNH